MEALERPPWNPRRQCTGTNRAGERCQRNAIPGGFVCVMHGGKIPAVQQSAKVRLLAMVEPVLAAFEEILDIWRGTRCETCGKPTGDPAPVIRVGQLVLDRAGFGPSATMQVVSTPDEYDDASLDELIAHTENMLEELRGMRDAERALLTTRDVVLLSDACLVPEDDDELRSIPPGEGTNEPAND